MRVAAYDEHPLGLTWVGDEFLSRASHALAHEGRVWIVDPVDAGDALDRARALGEPAGVLQLFLGHRRDCAAVAKRLGVPHHELPAVLPDVPFSLLPLHWRRFWREVAMWWPEQRALVVQESIGTSPGFAVGSGPAGLHPLRRLGPPGSLRSYRPEHLLVGHGAALHGGLAAAGLLDALANARRDLPNLAMAAPGLIRRMRARR